MKTMNLSDIALFENRFWLQIMGDHSRFIYYSLAPNEVEDIQKAQEFIHLFDQMLEHARKSLSTTEIRELSRRAFNTTKQLREFKVSLLARSLNAKIKIHLPPTFLNDTLNELDEYLLILNTLSNGQTPLYHPLHYHILWLMDAMGHAASVVAELDPIEKDLIEKGQSFEKEFTDLYMKSIFMNGYLRTQMTNFSSLQRLNSQVEFILIPFMNYLETIRDLRITGTVLGTLLPLMADHMAREECYYLWKLSDTVGTLKRPECNPNTPRIET